MSARRNILISIITLSLIISIPCLLIAAISRYGEIDTLNTTCEVVTHKVVVSYSFLFDLRYRGHYGVCHIIHEWTKDTGETTTLCRERSLPVYFSNEILAKEHLLQHKPIRLYYPCFYSRQKIGYSFDKPYDHKPYLRFGLLFFYINFISIALLLINRHYEKDKNTTRPNPRVYTYTPENVKGD